MSDIAILKEMIKESATVPLVEDSYGKKQVTLREPALPNYFVTIRGMPSDDQVIIIKVDDFTSPEAIFCGSKGECKRADFVIIADTGKKKVILNLKVHSVLSRIVRKLAKNFGLQSNFWMLMSIDLSLSEISIFIRSQHGRQ